VNWENDKSKPDYAAIPELCQLLGIRLHELFGVEAENGLDPLEDRVICNLRLLSPGTRRIVDRMISTITDEALKQKDARMKESFTLFLVRPGAVAAGAGDYVPDEPPSYTFLRRNSVSDQADGIVMVHGASMEPVYHDGDYVYYRASSGACPGEDVIVDTDDGAVIKRVAQNRTLYSVNTALPYPGKTEDNALVIRGIVLGVVQSSDRPSPADSGLLEELFADEIRSFRQKYQPGEWS